jgi:hypothetical protein
VSALILSSCLLLAQKPLSDPLLWTPERRCVGDISICGNFKTPDGKILDVVNIYPGQYMPSENELRSAEQKMLKKFRKQLGTADSNQPRIEIRRSESSKFDELIIYFPERPGRK